MTIQVGSRTFADADALEKLVIHAATEYEVNGYVEDFDGTEVTDPEYDALFKALRIHKPKSKAFKGASPSTAKAKGKTVKHDPPMTSIDKADGDLTEKDAILQKWVASCAAKLGVKESEVEIAGSFKHDGVALRVNYVDGKMVSAGLRPRDGVNGSDVTRHMKYVTGVPLELPLPLTLSLNGEIECWTDDFAEVNKARDAAGEDAYKNPRNYTAGCMGRDDPEENKDARLRVCFYSITGFDDWETYYKTEIERAKWANGADGLNLQDAKGKGYFVQVRKHEYRHLALMEGHAKKLPYYTDGVVLKVNNLDHQYDLGHSGDDATNPPRGALAWKFEEETAEADISRIEWNASRTGRIVPTALFDTPFVLADTSNNRATCNNYGWMENLGIGPGAKVRCKKGGKIIPNIMAVITPVSDTGAPKSCPTCASTLELVTSASGNKDLLCKSADCPAKHIKGWLFYVQTVGGKGLGGSAMEKIVKAGLVKRLDDLYGLTVDALVKQAGFSDRQATLALATIWQVPPGPESENDQLKAAIVEAQKVKQQIDAPKFFKALGIPGAGETAGKVLVAHYGDLDSVRFAKEEDLQKVAGIGPTTAKSIADWFKVYNPDVEHLLMYVEPILPKKGKLTGQNFVLTGAFTKGKKHWEKLIEDQGGNIQSSVGKTTTYLIQEHGKSDGSPSDKEQKAAKYGTKVISVADLEKLL